MLPTCCHQNFVDWSSPRDAVIFLPDATRKLKILTSKRHNSCYRPPNHKLGTDSNCPHSKISRKYSSMKNRINNFGPFPVARLLNLGNSLERGSSFLFQCYATKNTLFVFHISKRQNDYNRSRFINRF